MQRVRTVNPDKLRASAEMIHPQAMRENGLRCDLWRGSLHHPKSGHIPLRLVFASEQEALADAELERAKCVETMLIPETMAARQKREDEAESAIEAEWLA